MVIGSTILLKQEVIGSMKTALTADIGNMMPMITQLELGTTWTGQLMVLGILTLKMQPSNTLSIMVGMIQVAQIPTMVKQIHSVTVVKTTLIIPPGVIRMIQIHLFQVRCAVPAVEAILR